MTGISKMPVILSPSIYRFLPDLTLATARQLVYRKGIVVLKLVHTLCAANSILGKFRPNRVIPPPKKGASHFWGLVEHEKPIGLSAPETVVRTPE